MIVKGFVIAENSVLHYGIPGDKTGLFTLRTVIDVFRGGDLFLDTGR